MLNPDFQISPIFKANNMKNRKKCHKKATRKARQLKLAPAQNNLLIFRIFDISDYYDLLEGLDEEAWVGPELP